MTTPKYLILAALGFGALAFDSGAAEASTYTNRTVPWCMPRLSLDLTVVSGASAVLIWKATGDLVLEPKNHFSPWIWSSGTAGQGKKLCFEANGTLAVHDSTNAKIWSQGGGSVALPPSSPSLDYDYVIKPSISGCSLSAEYKVYAAQPAGMEPWQPSGMPAGQGTLWTRTGVCPAESESATSTGWCITSAASGPQRILESKWAELVYRPYSGYLELVGRGTAAGQQIWSSQTNGTGQNYKLCFEDTGRLAIFDAAGEVRWSTPAGPTTTGYMLGIDGCNFGVTPLDGSPAHTIPSPRCPQTQIWNNRTVPVGASDVVLVENDVARLAFQPDGNLVLRSAGGDEIWHSALAAGRGKRLAFQADGNLVIYDAANAPVWAANVAGQGVTNLTLDGCAFSLNDSVDFQVVSRWSRGSATCETKNLTNSPAWELTTSGNLTLLRTEESRLVWQHDGNLVLYTASGQPVWASNTHGKGKKLAFKGDGNLVITAPLPFPLSGTETLWSSHTTLGWGTRTLKLRDNCTLTIASSNTTWTANDVCRVLNYSYERVEGDSTFGVVMHSHVYADSGASARVESGTGIDLTIFDQRINLFSGLGEQAQSNGSTSESATITIHGESTHTLNFTYEQVFWEQSRTFMAGPVPVVITAAATGSLALSFSVGGDDTMSVTPSAGIYATVTAGIGAGDGFASASAGVRGQLTLIELSLPVSLKVSLGTPGQRSYTVRGDLTLATLSGALSFYAEASIEVWGIEVSAEWSRTFFEWEGIEWSKNLFDKTGLF